MSEVTTVGALPPVPVFLSDGQATTTSRDVAEFFGKLHKNVLRDIEQIGCSDAFSRLNFEHADYTDAKGEARRMYRMTRDGFAFLAMGFTGSRAAQFKEAFIAAFNAMEARLRGSVPPAIQASVDAVSAKVDRLDAALQQMAAGINTLANSTAVVQQQLHYAHRYVGMLERNQRGYSKITRELEAEIKALRLAGMSTNAIARLLRIPRTTAYTVMTDQYKWPTAGTEGQRPPLDVQAVLEQMIAKERDIVLALGAPQAGAA